jgi:protein-disulfide isomerase
MSKLNYWQIVAILLIGAILGYVGAKIEAGVSSGTPALENNKIEVEQEEPPSNILSEDMQKLLVDENNDDPMLGDENAPVTIVEFSEFQCPFCKRYSEMTLNQIKEKYIDTGKVKYYFRDIPLMFHPQANDAAKAANCAIEQEKYWEMHDKIFEHQSEWSGNSEVVQLLATYAKEIGLDIPKWEECVADQATMDEITADSKTATILGVTGTPTFFVNGEKMVGAQPFVNFETLIEKYL